MLMVSAPNYTCAHDEVKREELHIEMVKKNEIVPCT